jgi:lipoprotein-releasing system permease protein
MLKLFLWLRYLQKKKIVFLSFAAVALSVALLIVVASLFTGFINAFERSAVEMIGDVVVSPPTRFPKYPQFIEQLEQLNSVKKATAVLFGQGLLHLGKGDVRAVEIWGIEPARRAEVMDFKSVLLRQKGLPGQPSFEVQGQPGKIGGFVGIGVLAEPNEKTDEYNFEKAEKMTGRQVVLTTGTVIENKEGQQGQFKRKTVEFTIADIVYSGVYYSDKAFVYLPIEELQKVLYPNEDGQAAKQIQIKLADGANVDAALAQIRGVWEDFASRQLGWDSYLIRSTSIETAKQMQSQLVAEFRKQMGVLLLIFGIVSLSAVLLIFCIFYMIVMTRQKDIAIIKSCGAGSGSVASIFIGFGACVGVIGSAIGTAIGYVITKNINVVEHWIRIIFGLKIWKSSIYLFSRIPNEVDWASAKFIVVLAVIAAVVGALIPAIVAAKTRPVEILRYE